MMIADCLRLNIAIVIDAAELIFFSVISKKRFCGIFFMFICKFFEVPDIYGPDDKIKKNKGRT